MCSLLGRFSRSLIVGAPNHAKCLSSLASQAVQGFQRTMCIQPQIGYLPPANPDKIIIDPRVAKDVYTVPGRQPVISELILPSSVVLGTEIREDTKTESSRTGYKCAVFYNNMLWIRHRKMKRHQRRKFKKKYLTLILKTHLKREIKREKLFRAEILTQIMQAEKFDAEAYVKNMLETIENKPKQLSVEERLQRLRQLIRENRSETNVVKPDFEDPVPSGRYVPKN